MTVDTSLRRKVGSRRAHKVNAMTFAILCKLMMDGTRTCYELAADSGLHIMTVYDWTATLHKHGVIHICMWEGEGRSSMRIFKFGPGVDVPRPIKPRSVVSAQHRAKRKAAQLLQRMAGKMEGETV